jgi:6-phosphogluconate dehydrogenase (decarboxylating)
MHLGMIGLGRMGANRARRSSEALSLVATPTTLIDSSRP